MGWESTIFSGSWHLNKPFSSHQPLPLGTGFQSGQQLNLVCNQDLASNPRGALSCLWPSDSVPGTAQGLPRAVERSFKSQGLSLSLSLHQRPINNLLAKVNDLWGVSWLPDRASPAGTHQKPSHCRLGWLLSGLGSEAFPGLASRGQSSVALTWV